VNSQVLWLMNNGKIQIFMSMLPSCGRCEHADTRQLASGAWRWRTKRQHIVRNLRGVGQATKQPVKNFCKCFVVLLCK